MLDDFISSNREAIIANALIRVASRGSSNPTARELANGIPVFLEQLGDALHTAKSTNAVDHEEIDQRARRHGHDLLQMGFTIGQVVHDYGDVCQTITELAIQKDATISGGEFQTLNLCLDDAIASAVTEFAKRREQVLVDEGTQRLGVLAHELRNLLNIATLSFESIKSGRVTAGGATGLMHERTLMRLGSLIDRSLADVRLDAGIERVEHISVAELLEEVEIGAMIHARARGLEFNVATTTSDPTLTVNGDRQILSAAITNLLHNAFKFTRNHGCVSLTTSVTADRVLFAIEDECGGLPPGKTEDLFRPFEQRGSDRSGVGLGLTICMKAAKANGGELHVRDLPGKGCVFTLDLPRSTTAA